ncbi:MAG: RES domain-containing protein [Candidatus Eremiobacteraeota bacterium]|nr:RES domain-containing protein [Candidatus Eremiobacteraeota bacterium]
MPRTLESANPPRDRFDDPQSTYHVIYASSQPLGCFMECLARYRRPTGELAARFRADIDAIEGENDFIAPGLVPTQWFSERRLGLADAKGCYADVYHSTWQPVLRQRLGGIASEYGFEDINLAELMQDACRPLTQAVSQLVFGHADDFDGIRYTSKLGHDIENWALFEPYRGLRPLGADRLSAEDPDFLEALRRLDLAYEGEHVRARRRRTVTK